MIYGCIVLLSCSRKDDHSSTGGVERTGLDQSGGITPGLPRSALTSPDGSVYRSDLGRTGFYKDSSVSRLRRGRPIFRGSGRAEGSLAVFQGTIFYGTITGFFYAIDVETGAEKWRFLAGRIESSPGVAGDYVYFGTSDGHLYSLNASTGKEVWRFKTRGEVRGAPVAYRGIVYATSRDGHLYALDAETGDLIWKAHLGVGGDELAISDGRIFLRSGEFLVAVDTETGRILWVIATEGFCHGIVATSGTVLAMAGRNLHAFEAETGQSKWTFEAEEGIRSTAPIAMAEGVVFFPDEKGNMYAVYADTGRAYWVKRTDGSVVYLLSVAGGNVYYVTTMRDLRTLNFRFPQDVQRIEVGNIHAGPIVSGNSVYLLANGTGESGIGVFSE